jgi:transcriptional regulator with XRE-family HTH domain
VSNLRQAREALGTRLRELRVDAHLSGRQLAALLGWNPSKVSKLELGRQTPTEDDIHGWVRATDADGAEADLIASLRTIETQYAEWRRVLRAGTQARQLSILEQEAQTTTFRFFEASLVPGLLQTAEYARVRLAGVIDRYNVPDDIGAGVQARMRRQEILYRSDKSFHFLVTEAALCYGVAPRDVAMGQLDRLLALTTLPRIRLGVIPLTAQYPVPPLHGFALFDDRIVLVETLAAELTLTQPQEIELYSTVFDRLAGVAKYSLEARRIIVGVLERMESGAEKGAQPR